MYPAVRDRAASVPPDGQGRLADPTGKVTLPVHLDWSPPGRVWDLANPAHRRRVCELVLENGTSQDVVEWLNPGQLRADVPHLVLPRSVLAVWQPWFHGT